MRHLLGFVAATLIGCATVPFAPGPVEHLAAHDGTLTVNIEYQAADATAARQIAEGIPTVSGHLKRWGSFRVPVTIRVLPSHEALESAVGNPGYPWLRAWARYDAIELQSPRTWADGGTKEQVGELLTHELTHCLMYQLSGTAADWAGKVLPLWFREGMASVTAEQGYRRPTNEELSNTVQANPGVDPLVNADDLYQGNARLVYGAAHRAFEFLIVRYGEDRVRQLLRQMMQGRDFEAAFQQGVGIAHVEFEAEFLRFLRWRGWQGRPAKLPVPLVPASR